MSTRLVGTSVTRLGDVAPLASTDSKVAHTETNP